MSNLGEILPQQSSRIAAHVHNMKVVYSITQGTSPGAVPLSSSPRMMDEPTMAHSYVLAAAKK